MRRVVIVVMVLVLLLVGIGVFAYRQWQDWNRGGLHDALVCAAREIEMLRWVNPRPTAGEIEGAMRELDRQSVTNLWHDAGENVVDPWGSPFSFTFDETKPGSRVTATSAGPDTLLGTGDDVSASTR